MRYGSTVLLGCVAAALVSVAARPQDIPQDANGGCPIAPEKVSAFFKSGQVTLNGVVKPADSTVHLNPNCDFFQWSEQMFLWLTSPAPRSYGGGSRIMFSPKFFTVSPPDAAGRRTFIRNNPGLPLQMRLRTTELGPHMLPALLSRSGHVIEVRQPASGPQPPLVRLSTGALAPIGDVRRTAAGLQFFDARGAALQVRRLALPKITRPVVEMPDGRRLVVIPARDVQRAVAARKLMFRGVPVFLDLAGNVIDVEPGQADNGVLITQNGSLIYYITAVNDVFAFHRTMQSAAAINDQTTLRFPMTMADANAVKAFAATKGHVIVEPEALAIETKSSWVEATAVPNPDDYVTVTATVPTFDKSNPARWVPNGQKQVKLVMVGIHVVGSTFEHGEMVWGTFEHFGNAPNAPYRYNGSGGVKDGPVGAGPWLFAPSGPVGSPNVSHASWQSEAIVGVPDGAAVQPSSIVRTNPWGMVGTSAGMNTQVISANWSVMSRLKPGDVRARYFQLGTTWTIGGESPDQGGIEVGTNHLANATIESFMQATPPSDAGSNCFSCHRFNTVATSHVYGALKPLP